MLGYVGEVIDEEEADKREQVDAWRANYFWLLHQHQIDPSLMGNVARFLNHSCKGAANLEGVEVPMSGDDVSQNTLIILSYPYFFWIDYYHLFWTRTC